MKITSSASSIVSLACFFILAGCDSIHVPNLFGRDEVPDDVKNGARMIEIPMDVPDGLSWPNLGDVPFKPKNLEPQSSYDESIGEMEQNRRDAQEARRRTLEQAPDAYNAAVQDVAPQDNRPSTPLVPPQFVDE